ncbi:hypothetical protein [Nitratidesulfovibrio vulgaris]|uniref:hypothetical protein n=1 Tax=Nitratidesulfovibrio vulgaris TaxID=881 RepID=UPI002301EB17|nr:hypothetical protein [Nitratidesulfovibrio vulgaris]WCB45284.1 hypothetical protein PH214_09325 [Nitratidesulfovibrio vulgaris]
MSVSRDYTPHTYSGDGAQAAFPVRWVFHDTSWVRAQRIVGGVATDLANGTDYTVQQGVDVGGTLTLATPLAAGAKLLIWRDVPFEQLDRYTNTGLFDVRVVERGMDRLTVMAQQLREAVGRCVQVRMDSTTRPDQIMNDINSALAGAQASAGAAAGSATAAGAAKDGAEAARAGAEAAKAGAENARNEASVLLGEVTAGVVLNTLRDMRAGDIVLRGHSTIRTLSDGLPEALELNGDVVSLITFPRLVRAWCGASLNATAPAFYRCSVAGVRDAAGAHFKLLDMRGYVPRGWDHGRGIDTDRVLASLQEDQNKSHQHQITKASNRGAFSSFNTACGRAIDGGSNADYNNATVTTAYDGGSEARMRNAALMFIIYV